MTVRFAALYDTLAATGELPSRSLTVLLLIVAGSIASLKVTVTAALVGKLVAPFAGLVLVTVGGVVSVGAVAVNTTSTQ